MDSYKLLLQLLKAKDENSVKIILEKNNLWGNEDHWRPYGDNENNEGTTDNQQDSAIAALMEKPINSLDAVLIKECRLNGIDPKCLDAPKSMQEAVEKFFNVKNGDFFEECHAKRNELALNVRIIAEGDTKEPNIVIVDRGEGQIPEKFPNTFLSLTAGEGEKSDIDFVQGRYNMGGSGALGYCGEYHFQLIISKKHPALSNGNDLWGFTLVREHPTKSEYEKTWAEYLIDPEMNNNVLSFSKEALDILPKKEKMSYGTYIKLYNYRLTTSHRSHFGRGFQKEVNRILYSPPLPILIQETRFGNNIDDRLLLGNRTRIRDHKVEEKERSKVEDSEDYANVDLGIFNNRNIEIHVFKEGTHKTPGRWGGTDEFTSKEQAVMFTINGQTHHALKRTFFCKAKLDFIKDELMVHVDCTSVPVQRRRKVFMASRDRVRKSNELKEIESDLLDLLRNDEWLKKLNHLREEKSIVHNAKDQNFANKVLSKLVKVNPEISTLLNIGNQLKTGIDKDTKKQQRKKRPYVPAPEPPPFEGKKFPTLFEIYNWDSKKGIFCKDIPQNSYVRIKFKTDVRNDYLNEIRAGERGYFKCNFPNILKASGLRNGVLTTKIEAPEEKQVGSTFVAKFELTHPYQESFVCKIQFNVVKPQQTKEGDGRTKDELEKNIPRPIPVYAQIQEGIERGEYKIWEEMTDFEWNEETVSQVKEGKSTDVYINMESIYLRNFLKRQRNISDKRRDAIRRNYKIAILLYSMILKSKVGQIDDGSNLDEENLFQVMMQGVGSIILDLIIDNNQILDYEEEE